MNALFPSGNPFAMQPASPSNAGSSSGAPGPSSREPAVPLRPQGRGRRGEEAPEAYASWDASAAGHA